MRGPRSRGSRIYLVQLVAVAAGIALVVANQWRVGIIVVGAAFVAGAAARVVTPLAHTGMLRVRGKIFDIAWMTLLGVSLITLALIIPTQPG
jgi:hypothetical protein